MTGILGGHKLDRQDIPPALFALQHATDGFRTVLDPTITTRTFDDRSSILIVASLMNASGPALAQQSSNPPIACNEASSTPAGAPTNPDLMVTTVKLQGELRARKLIGSPVYNEQNEKVGSVDDLIVKDGGHIVMAVVSIGGFLGLGNKLVAVPYGQMHLDTNKDETKVTMPGASRDALNEMATFTYGG